MSQLQLPSEVWIEVVEHLAGKNATRKRSVASLAMVCSAWTSEIVSIQADTVQETSVCYRFPLYDNVDLILTGDALCLPVLYCTLSAKNLRSYLLHDTMKATSYGKLVKSATLALRLDVDHDPMCDDECAFTDCDYDDCFEFGKLGQSLALRCGMQILGKFADLQLLSIEINHMIEDSGGELVFNESCIELPSLQELLQLPFNPTVRCVRLVSEGTIYTGVANCLVAWIRHLPQLSSLEIKRIQFFDLFSSSRSLTTNLTSLRLDFAEPQQEYSGMADLLAVLAEKNNVRRLEIGWARLDKLGLFTAASRGPRWHSGIDALDSAAARTVSKATGILVIYLLLPGRMPDPQPSFLQ